MNDRTNQSLLDKNTQINKPTSNSAALDLWTSVRHILELQNQAPDLKSLPKDEHILMSFNQEHLWLLDRLRPNDSVYNIPFAFRLLGELPKKILEKSLQVLVQRHEVLRTNFRLDSSNRPIQEIKDITSEILQCFDLAPYTSAEGKSAIDRFIQEQALKPFDLSQDNLFRAMLLRISDREHILVFNVHHIIFDGWSEGILFREISTLYEAFTAGIEPSLNPLTVQYADFSVWQRQWLQGDFRQALIDYWQNNLGNSLTELALPTDYSRPARQLRAGACETLYISPETTQALKKLARQEKATLFPTLLAAFKVLLVRYTQQTNVLVCTPTANRNRRELKENIGYFVNLLVLRTDLSESISFRQAIAMVKQSAFGASTHQDLPARELANCIEGSQAPLSQILFALQNTPQKPLALAGLEVERLEVDNGKADFDLFLSLTEEAGSIRGILKYNTDLFAAETISLLLQHYQRILAAVIVNPDLAIDCLLPLTPLEAQKLAAMRQRNVSATLSTKDSDKQEYLAPRNEIEEKLVAIWQDLLDLKQIGITHNFFELGGKSLAAVQLFIQIEKIFERKIPFSKIFEAPTIEQLAALIAREESSPQSKSLVAIQPEGTKPPLFCIHSVEPSIIHYKNLADCLDRDRPFYGLQPPALSGDNQIIYDKVEEMAAQYIKEIKSFQPNGPYYLTGHSMGGLIAYEIACQLQLQGEEIAFLGLIDTFAPGYQPKPRFHLPSPLYRFYIHCLNLVRVTPKRKVGYILQRIKKIIPTFLWNRLDKSALLINDSIHNELPAIYQNLPIYRTIKLAHYRAYNSYSPTNYYAGKMTLYRATERPTTITYYPCLGWKKLANQTMDVREIAGDHNTVMHYPYVRDLGLQFQNCLN